MAEKAPKVGDMIKPSETITAGQSLTLGGIDVISGAAGVITAVGTVLDIANNVSDNREAKKMKKQQEDNIKEKNKRVKKAKRRKYRKYDSPLSTNGVVQDMFNQSTGHTKYGASTLPGT